MRLGPDWRERIGVLSLALIPSLSEGQDDGNTCFFKWLWELIEDSYSLLAGREFVFGQVRISCS